MSQTYWLNPRLINSDRKTFRWYYGENQYNVIPLNEYTLERYKQYVAKRKRTRIRNVKNKPFPAIGELLPKKDKWVPTSLSNKNPLTKKQLKFGSILASDFLARYYTSMFLSIYPAKLLAGGGSFKVGISLKDQKGITATALKERGLLDQLFPRRDDPVQQVLRLMCDPQPADFIRFFIKTKRKLDQIQFNF